MIPFYNYETETVPDVSVNTKTFSDSELKTLRNNLLKKSFAHTSNPDSIDQLMDYKLLSLEHELKHADEIFILGESSDSYEIVTHRIINIEDMSPLELMGVKTNDGTKAGEKANITYKIDENLSGEFYHSGKKISEQTAKELLMKTSSEKVATKRFYALIKKELFEPNYEPENRHLHYKLSGKTSDGIFNTYLLK